MKNDEQTMDKYLKISEDQQKAVLRRFAKLPVDSKIKVFALHRKFFYKLKQKRENEDIAILSYVSFIKSILELIGDENSVQNRVLRIKFCFKRANPKQQAVLDKWSLVKELKEKHKFSYRDISNYLLKHHKLKVAHSTIYKMWQELEQNKEK